MTDSEQPSTAALTMDRGLPLGNSLDAFSRRALHTKIGNAFTDPVPVTITSGGTQAPVTNTYGEVGDVPPSAETEIVAYTVPVGKTLYLSRVQFDGDNFGRFQIKIDGSTIASFQTWWGEFSGEQNFFTDQSTGFPATAGQVISVTALHSSDNGNGLFSARIQGVLL